MNITTSEKTTTACFQPDLSVGFVGHRVLRNPGIIRAAITGQLKKLSANAEGRSLVAISSIAIGADTLFAQAALEAKIPWQLYLPFPEAEFSKDFSEHDWLLTAKIIQQAVSIDRDPMPDNRELPAGDSRNIAYAECGCKIVDESDILLAVWDGKPARGHGGAQESIDYAQALGKRIIIISATDGAVREIPAQETMPLDKPSLWTPPWRRAHKQASDHATRVGVAEEETECDSALRKFKLSLEENDALAKKYAPKARNLATLAILLHLGATVLAVSGMVFYPPCAILATLVLIKVAILFTAQRSLAHSRTDAQSRWHKARIRAELCRSAIATWRLPYSESIHRDKIFAGDRDWMHSLWLRRRQAVVLETPLLKLRETYLKERVDDQLNYFQKRYNEAAWWQKLLSLCATLSTWVAIFLGLLFFGVLIASHCYYGEDPHSLGSKLIKLFSVILPLLSAALLHLTVGREYGRREARNREMLIELKRMRTRIERAETPRHFAELVAETETLLLVELFEWQTYVRFGSVAH